jgi:hypothetical protein
LRQINLKHLNAQAMTDGPVAVGNLFVWVWLYLFSDNLGGGQQVQQLHFTYRGSDGAIWDAYWEDSNQIPDQPSGRAGP